MSDEFIIYKKYIDQLVRSFALHEQSFKDWFVSTFLSQHWFTEKIFLKWFLGSLLILQSLVYRGYFVGKVLKSWNSWNFACLSPNLVETEGIELKQTNSSKNITKMFFLLSREIELRYHNISNEDKTLRNFFFIELLRKRCRTSLHL